MIEAPDFLEPGGALRGRLFARLAQQWAAVEPAVTGQRIGAFRVERELGRGGMGVVYLAERVDGGFAQQVALKFVRGNAQASGIQELFRRERSLLAALDHPHIARLIDGGQSDDGWLWFAMERIEGLRIDRHVHERGLDLQQRLGLFVQVCDAVAFAHQRLVVHRDIKPANILVSADGWVKLLDFGIAALADAGTGAPQALTPGWASPEQARGEVVTTASDVFQLGLLLHALVCTGRWRALESTGLDATRADAHAGECAPLAGAAVAEADLASIIAKCTHDDIESRYPSVAALRDDVRARMARRPVAARDGGWSYRLRLAVTRHPWVTTACIAAALTLALLGSQLAREGNIARAAAAAAATQAERARASLGFLTGLLGEAQPATHQGHVPTVEDLLQRGSQRIVDDRQMPKTLRAELAATLGAIHIERGEFAQARALLETAVPALREPAGDASILAQAIGNLAYTLEYTESARSLPMFDEALALLVDDDSHAELRLRIARYRASVLYGSGRRAESAEALHRVLDEDRAVLGDTHAETAMAKMMYAIALSALDRDADALPLIESSFRTLEAGLGREHPRTLQAGQTLAITFSNLDRYEEQAALMQELVPRVAKVFGERSPRYARTLTWYGVAQSHTSNPAAAVPTLQHALEIFDAAPALDDLGSPNTLQALGETYERLGQSELALAAYRRMLVRVAERPSSVPVDDGKRPLIVARLLLGMHRYDEVQGLIGQARANAHVDSDPARRIVGSIDLAQAQLDAATGDLARAAACARSAVAVLAKFDYARDEYDQARALSKRLPPASVPNDAPAACDQAVQAGR
ncbi:protein kinase domain-containing protein [Dokdonella sp.]|uniref:protein kinase domain-containing protein n=1 Tax=Dokdonella sp. TaxID=2291710 RepID=UPI0037839DBE